MGRLTGSSRERLGASLFVAASDAPSRIKRLADFICDGVADNATIALAHSALPSGGGTILLSEGTFEIAARVTFSKATHLKGQGDGTVLNFASGDIGPAIGASNSSVSSLRCTGSSSSGFVIGSSASVASPVRNVKVYNCTFEGINQVVFCFNVDGVLVQGNTFNGTDYGVIAQFAANTEAHNVIVTGNYFRNMSSDCVSINGNNTNTNKLRGWVVANNVFDGNTNHPTEGTEERFLSMSYVHGTVIQGNVIRHASGDSAIQIEATGGEVVIQGNYFEDCIGDSYVLIITSDANMVINGNLFYLSDTGEGSTNFIRMADSSYNSRLAITGNRFTQAGGSRNVNAIVLVNTEDALIAANQFEQCNAGVRCNTGVTDLNISGNFFYNCTYGIDAAPRAATGGAHADWLIQGNKFEDTQTACLEVLRNTNATSPSSRFFVTGNFFDNNVNGVDTVDMTLVNNFVASGVTTFNLGASGAAGGSTGSVRRNNRGFVTENSGTGTINSGATSATVTHGLGVTPTVDDISISFGEQGTNDYGRWWISGISSTQFTLNVSSDPGASNLDFGWRAVVL